jgi:hypothetical protein
MEENDRIGVIPLTFDQHNRLEFSRSLRIVGGQPGSSITLREEGPRRGG